MLLLFVCYIHPLPRRLVFHLDCLFNGKSRYIFPIYELDLLLHRYFFYCLPSFGLVLSSQWDDAGWMLHFFTDYLTETFASIRGIGKSKRFLNISEK